MDIVTIANLMRIEVLTLCSWLEHRKEILTFCAWLEFMFVMQLFLADDVNNIIYDGDDVVILIFGVYF